MIRLTMVGAFPPQECGEGEYAFAYVKKLLQLIPNLQITVIAHKAEGESPMEDLSSSLSNRIRIVRPYSTKNWIKRNLSFIFLFTAIVKSRPHIVHFTYGPNEDFGGRIGEPLILLLLLLRILNIPVITTLHSTWLPRDLIERGTELGHSMLLGSLMIGYFGVFTKLFTMLNSQVLVLTTTENSDITHEFVDTYGLSPEKVGEESHGCNFNPVSNAKKQQAKQKLGLSERNVILFFGFIRPDKGLEDLIYAFANLPNSIQDSSVLLIAGNTKTTRDREYFSYLQSLAKDYDISDSVIFDRRYVPDRELQEYIDAADIVVFPYKRNVGASGPLHHVLSRGKAVVGSRVGFLSIMEDSIALYERRDHENIASTLRSLLGHKSAIDKLEEKGKKYAASHDWSHVVSKNIEKYRALLGIDNGRKND